MAKITAAEVNNLRKMTGAGMMDCKKALMEAEGDVEKAIDILRKKGQKVASKRADRDAKEGKIIAKVNKDNTFGGMIMLNCETDFVANSEAFVDFANQLIDLAIEKEVKTLEELNNTELDGVKVSQAVLDLTGKTGEKTTLAHYEVLEAPLVCEYNHLGNRVGTLLSLNKNSDVAQEVGHELCMQVAAMAPIAVDENSVSKEIIEKELEIAKETLRQEGKPENMIEKIAKGKLNRFFKDNTLLNQMSISDSKQSVADYIKKADPELKVMNFKRLILGE